jgi:hypothetical protein
MPGATNSRPVRMIDPAFPSPSSADSNASAPAATETATQPPAAAPQSQPASTAASQAPQDDSQTTVHDAATHDAASPRKTTVTRKRVTVTNSRQRTYYDYYDRDNRDNDDQQRASAAASDNTVRARPDSRDMRARRGVSQTQQRIVVRRRDDYDRDGRDGGADRGAFPAQPRPAQSFFGPFDDRH